MDVQFPLGMGNPPRMPGTQRPREGGTSTSPQPLVRARHILLSWSSDVGAVRILSLPDCSRELAELQGSASVPATPGRPALSGRSRHRPALRGRTGRRTLPAIPACCNLSAPLRGSRSPSMGTDPRPSRTRSPPGAPTPRRSAPGPTAENRKSIRKGNTGGGPACTQRHGPAPAVPAAGSQAHPSSPPSTPARGESPNVLPADPHPARLT